MKKIFCLFTFFINSLAFAGGGSWIGAGGGTFDFQKNPWFLDNVKEVHYCVSVDTATVSASPEIVKDNISQAFQYWKNELSHFPSGPGFMALATQTFILDPACNKETPLRFLVGYGSLSSEESSWSGWGGDTTNFIGMTVRQNYTFDTLVGSGFIYISSDLGPKTYHNAGNLLAGAWKYPQLLQYALLHEIGHVMGIPHVGTGLMSEVFLDQLLHSKFYKFYLDNPVQSYLNPPMTFDVCITQNGNFNATFFGVPANSSCLRLEGTRESSGQFVWNVFSRALPTSPAVGAGTLRGWLNSANLMGSKPAVTVQLPIGQTAVSLKDIGLNSFLIGPTFVEGTIKANFILASSPRPYDVQVEAHADSITMTAVVNGNLSQVLVYSPASLLNMVSLPINH